jgi:ABC-type multidrug transport system fused ATPase/permease subunit
MKYIFNKLHSLLTYRDKQFLLGLLFFSFIISIIETIGISIIMPFIALSTDFSLIQSNEYYQFFYKIFNFHSEINFILSFGVILIFFYLFRSLINYLYFHLLARFSQGRYHLLAYRLFQNYLGMSYQNFVSKNSSVLTKAIINEASNLTSLVSAVLVLVSDIFIVIFICRMMLYVN